LEKISEYQRLLSETAQWIEGERLAGLDFDRLREAFVEVVDVLEVTRLARADLSLLRQDYIGRISGMEKAIAIAGRGDDALKRALVMIENLPHLSAAELIEQYSKTQARFRDAFPASFSKLSRTSPAPRRLSADEYK
jgi:hypothetical protein